MAYLQHIEHERLLRLAEQISAGPGQVVSKTLVQNGAVGITLFAFSEGSQISAHSASGDAMVTVLEGRGLLTVNGQRYDVSAGETLVMPAGKPHSVDASEPFKMLLTVIFPWEDKAR